MPLVTTPGAANADSFASLAEADAYHASRPTPADNTAWEDMSPTEKEAAMRHAARLLDAWRRAWTGLAVDAVQALSWPRIGMLSRNGFPIPTSGADSVPIQLKHAQSELAMQIKAEDRTEDSTLLGGIKSVDAGPVGVEFSEGSTDQRLALRRRDSLEAMIPDAVVMLLVESWLKDVRDEDLPYTSLIFESLEE